MNFYQSLLFSFLIFYKELDHAVNADGGQEEVTSADDDSDSAEFRSIRLHRTPVPTTRKPEMLQSAESISGTAILSTSATFNNHDSLFPTKPSQKVKYVSGNVKNCSPDWLAEEYLRASFTQNGYREVSPKLIGDSSPSGSADFEVKQVSNKIRGQATLQNKIVIQCFGTNPLPQLLTFSQMANSVSGATEQRLAVVIACKHFCSQPISVRQRYKDSSGDISQSIEFFFNCPKGVVPRLILNQNRKRDTNSQSVKVFVNYR